MKYPSGWKYIDDRPWLYWPLFILNGVIGYGFVLFVIGVAIAFYVMLFFIMAGLPDFL